MSEYLVTKSWGEFRAVGMLYFANLLLQFFGWSLVYVFDDKDEIIEVYPARTKFRGFDDGTNEDGHRKIATFIRDNAEKLYEEVMEE